MKARKISRRTQNFMENVERRERAKAAFKVSTQVRLLAECLPNQAALDTCLLQETDTDRRRKMFDFMKQWLKFPNPQFPSAMEQPRIVLLGQ